MDIKQKRIILIMPRYFGYESRIKTELEKQGAKVWIIYENMDEVNILYRWIYVYAPFLKNKVMDKYYREKIKKIGKKPDICLIIRGASLSENILLWMKEKYPNMRMIMYQWDSVANNPNAKLISKYCSKNLTFDMKDSKNYGWIYRPLFYFESSNYPSRKYDLTFIGSVHSKRLDIAKQLLSKYKTKNYIYLYSKIFHFIKQKFIKKNPFFKTNVHGCLHFSSLSIYETNKLFANSKVIVDYTHPDQNGYTMRTIESLGHHCKLVTNNRQIVKADFYDHNNIFIYDDAFTIPKKFIKAPYHDIPVSIYERYSITNWVNDILG